MVKEIDRKIYFHQIEWVLDDKSRVKKERSFLDDILSKNPKISYDETCDIVLENLDSLIPNKLKNSSLWRISKVRKTDLPQKYSETKMKAEPLDLKQDEGIYEPTHFILFDGALIGAEFNRYGPGVAGGLSMIIENFIETNKIAHIKRVEIKRIFRNDIYDTIDKIPEIRGLSIKIATNYAKLLKAEDNHTFGKIFSAADLVDDMSMMLSFKAGRSKKSNQSDNFVDLISIIKKILKRGDSKGNVKILNVVGKRDISDDNYEIINLLEQLMVCEKRITQIDDKTRVVSSIDMYKQIMESYETFQEELKDFITPI
jgi:hypothetical protein